MMLFNPNIIRQQIENLKISYPGLIDDDEAWEMSLGSETDIEGFLTDIVRRIEDAKALVVGTKDRFEDLKARKERFEHRIEVLRELAFKVMHAAELAKLELPEATLSLRAGTQQLVGDADPKDLPDDLCTITRTLNKKAIKERLQLAPVEGFTLSNASPSLSIRIK